MYKVRFDGYLDDSPYKDGNYIIGNIYEVKCGPNGNDLKVIDEDGDSFWERAKSFTKVEE